MQTFSHTIFYADDDQDDLAFFEEAVCALPVRYKLFENGFDLLKAVQNQTPSLIFVDLNMPIISGFDVILKMKANADLAQIPIVVLSTANDPHTVSQIKKMGASLYIVKPTTLAQLRDAISSVLNIDWQNFCPNNSNFLFHGARA